MKLHTERFEKTRVRLDIVAQEEELQNIKQKTLQKLAPQVKVAGFREGNVPIEVVEKNINPQTLQGQFIDEAVNSLYIAALKEEKLRPVAQPKVDIKKFVPFNVLEFTMELEVVGEITLPDYRKHGVKKSVGKITEKDVKGVLENLQTRAAEKNEVERAAKSGDEAWIDFAGKDSKGEPVQGADGKDYPLMLGSNTFIPGFEDNIIGMKPQDEKEFTVTFPKDYGAKALQSKKVTFTVTLNKVNEVKQPKLDDEFAGKVGPFKSLDELKEQIRTELEQEAERKAERDYEAAIVNKLADDTKVDIPEVLIEEQKQMVLQEVRQNVVQRGMTYEEFLASQGVSEEDYTDKEILPEAERRVKAALLLSEIADAEGIDVTPEELEARLQILKAQYKDQKMQDELDKPENRREINSRIRSEKVIAFLKK